MKSRTAAKEVAILLFDVGGVLVQLSGVETMLTWMGRTATSEELWRMWLQSTAVTAEFCLAVDPKRFLQSFSGWPTGLYPGTLEMLARIPPSYRRALLSNSNSLHWPRVINEMHLGSAFNHHFVSHLTGRIKPDVDAFEHVVASLGCTPGEVLFLDDNMINVDAARNFGMHAARVQGPAEVQKALCAFGILAAGC